MMTEEAVAQAEENLREAMCNAIADLAQGLRPGLRALDVIDLAHRARDRLAMLLPLEGRTPPPDRGIRGGE